MFFRYVRQFKVCSQIDGIRVLRGRGLDTVFWQITMFFVHIPEPLVAVVREMRLHKIDEQHPGSIDPGCPGAQPVDRSVHIVNVISPGAIMRPVLIETGRSSLTNRKGLALLITVEEDWAITCQGGFRKAQFADGAIGMDLADKNRMYPLPVQDSTQAIGFLGDIVSVVAVSLHSVYPFSGQKSGTTRYTQRRRAVGVGKQRAAVGKLLHVGRLHKVMAIG